MEYPPLAKALRSVGPIRTVLDAGANDGLSTRLFAKGLPEARVVALEPSLQNYAMLLRNTRDLTPRVTALRAALWNSSATMTIGGDASSPWALSVKESTSPSKGQGASTSLPGITIPMLLDALCVPRLDFLKMDIEGAEMSVLVKGSESWLKRVRYFYMESHAWAKDPDDPTHKRTAVAMSVQALANAGMTVLTNPNLTMATWIPSRPKRREYVFLACQKEVPRMECKALCDAWRAGTGLGCEFVNRYRARP